MLTLAHVKHGRLDRSASEVVLLAADDQVDGVGHDELVGQLEHPRSHVAGAMLTVPQEQRKVYDGHVHAAHPHDWVEARQLGLGVVHATQIEDRGGRS